MDKVGNAVWALCRGHFVAEALVFGLVVEKFVVAEGYNLCDWEDEFFGFRSEYSAVEFTAIDAFFNKHLAVFGECLLDGREKVCRGLDFGCRHTAASGSGFDEKGIAHLRSFNLCKGGLAIVVDKH